MTKDWVWVSVIGRSVNAGAGVLPELDALGGLFEANEEWQGDASAVRARMLGILLEVADRYVSLGAIAYLQSSPG